MRAQHRRRAAAVGGRGRGAWPGGADPAASANIGVDAHANAFPDGNQHGNPQPGADRKPNARAVATSDLYTRSPHAHRGASDTNDGSDRHSRRNFSSNGGRAASSHASSHASGRVGERPDLDLRHTDRRQPARRRPGRIANRPPHPPEAVV
jgi:hypothetical protein